MEANGATNPCKKSSKPIKMLAKLFNKGKRTASVPEVNKDHDDEEIDQYLESGPQLSDLAFVDSELEALHISRTDNPYLEILSSQDHLDNPGDNTNRSSAVMSPDESISPTNSGKEYSLTEIHAHLVRSPPPICWPVSPRSNGTFSPDSSDMDVDTAPIIPPTRGYSPYNRSQSEEHILSPCRELLKSTDFSPARGTTPELLGISMTTDGGCMSPYRDFDVRSERKMKTNVGRTSSFMSTNTTTGATRQPHFSGGGQGPPVKYSRAISYNRSSSNVYYTMNYSQEDDLDDQGLLSPNRNQYSFGARASRRSVGGLSLSPMSMSMVGTGNSGGNKYTNFFSSWRRSYRLRSKSSSSSAHKNNSTRKKDTKSLENLLDDERPIPRYSLDYEDEQDFDDK